MPDQKRGPARLEPLRQRRDFLAAAKGSRIFRRAFALQTAAAEGRATAGPRFGLTVTKKVGCAPERNRIKRRLRAVLRTMPENTARAGHDYVIVARREALYAKFGELADDLRRAIGDVHNPRNAPGRERKAKRTSAAKNDSERRDAVGGQDQANP